MISHSSFDGHSNRRRHFLISNASAPSEPAALESFDATHVTSSYKKYRGTIFGTYLYLSRVEH